MRKLGKVVVVGAGALGGYYGARLLEAGEDVTLLLRADYERVQENGLNVESVVGDFALDAVPCVCYAEDTWEQTVAELGEIDWVVVAWKATANARAQEVIAPLIGERTQIVTLQNGLGNDRWLAECFGDWRILGGLCFICVNRLENGVISHTASGKIRLGEYVRQDAARLELWQTALKAAKVPCELVGSLEKAQWMKLVWNVPFNGLAIAEGGVDTEQLLGVLGLEEEVRALMTEVAAVAAALGHQIEPHFIEQQITVTKQMGAYMASSAIDYKLGRPVELVAIWQEPLRVARSLGVPVPHMEVLCARIEQRLEARV